MAEYKGLMSSFPPVLQMHQSALTKTTEMRKNVQSDALSPADFESISDRLLLISSSCLAEVNHFQACKNQDVKDMMKLFLQQQINYQRQIQSKLQQALSNFHQLS